MNETAWSGLGHSMRTMHWGMGMQTRIIYRKHAVIHQGLTGEGQSNRYAWFSFNVEHRCTSMRLTFHQTSQNEAQLPLCLFDSEGKIRIMHAPEASTGPASQEYTLSMESSSKGCIPGDLPPGVWKFIVYKRRFSESIPITITVHASFAREERVVTHADNQVEEIETDWFSSACLESSPQGKWYNGELHTHSQESTGRTSIAEILSVARTQKLDFLAITDHFTASHWNKIQEVYQADAPPLLLKSMEVSGDRGHANIHGIRTWINPLVDDNAELSDFLELDVPPSMEQIADQVHQQGGLFSINHALSGGVSWRYTDFPIEKADILEVWCTPDTANTFLYPTMWDVFLCQGYRLIGVGSSDSHHPSSDGPWKLGNIRTWVYANELSQAGILAGLKAGRVFISQGDATLDFVIRTRDGREYSMGETLSVDEETSIEISVTLHTHTSGNLFVMISGFLYEVQYFAAGERDVYQRHVTVANLPRTKDGIRYIRLEFHEDMIQATYWGMAWRDYSSMRLLSNPIWISNVRG